ncbi:MAG: response regulator [Spartobacteria bacterium]
MSETTLICIVDDDPSVLKAQARLISSVGWEAKLFADPASFLSYAQTHHPALSVIDVWMPLMNGLEVQARLREISPSTKVIIFTGKEDSQVRSQALNAGAAAFFTKPFDDEEFIAAIRVAVAERPSCHE